MRNILLTGAHSPTGRLALEWLRTRYPEAALFAVSRTRVARPGVTPIVLDLADPTAPSLDRSSLALSDLPALDAVLHLAAVTPAVSREHEAFGRVNVTGARRLFQVLRYAPGASFFDFSSLSVYAASSRPVIGEDHPKTTTEPYGASKLAFEQVLAELAAERGLRALSVRIPVLLAPGIGGNFMAKWRDALLAGRGLTMFNPEAPFNACVWWQDLFALFEAFQRLGPPGHIACNTAAVSPLPVHEVARLFCRVFGAEPTLSVGPSGKPGQLVDSNLARSLGLPARLVLDAITLFVESSRSS